MAGEKKEIHFVFDEKTRNTFRYMSEEKDAAVQMVYVKKTATPGEVPPAGLTLTLEFDDD